jgi:hypothetical protein
MFENYHVQINYQLMKCAIPLEYSIICTVTHTEAGKASWPIGNL